MQQLLRLNITTALFDASLATRSKGSVMCTLLAEP
jgi:hypothetical protein